MNISTTKLGILACLLMSVSSSAQMRFHHLVNQATVNGYGFALQRTQATGTVPFVLCQTTRGVITVSGGRILFDPWQIQWTCPAIPPVPAPGVTPVNLDATAPYANTVYSFNDGRLNAGQATRVLRIPFRAWNMGLHTFPFRYRLPMKIAAGNIVGTGTTNFQLAFFFGRTIGYSYITTRGINNHSITFGIFGGPTTIDLKKAVFLDQSRYVSDQINPAISYGVNIVFARNNLGFVVGAGMERAFGNNADQWIYNDKIYLAFGISTSFGK